MSDKVIGDLSDRGRVEMRADLLAGSAGYRHFLEHLSGVISPKEAGAAYQRFAAARRLFWGALIVFAVAYVGINQLLGPHGLKLASWGNDFLRAGLFLVVVVLVKWRRVSVAGQMLLPLAALCYLPMPVIEVDDWYHMPLVFGAMVASLWFIGWCIDAGAEEGREVWQQVIALSLPLVAVVLFIALNILACIFVMDGAAWPVFSVLAALVAVPLLLFVGNQTSHGSDVDFLFFAAWKRWRFLLTGRGLAVLLGLVPFLLFANLLDYEEELELCLEKEKAPFIFRMEKHGGKEWEAFYWMQEGRFLRDTDLEPLKVEEAEHAGVLRNFYLMEPAPKHLPGHGPATAVATGHEAEPADQAANLYAEITANMLAEMKARNAMLALTGRRMTLEEFEKATEEFAPYRITSKEHLLERTKDSVDLLRTDNLVVVSYDRMGEGGVVFGEAAKILNRDVEELELTLARYAKAKWVFFSFGVFGFIFLWRRGGDSSLARWLGVWLVGVALVPIMAALDETLPHISHWLWQQSVMYRWNSIRSITQPIFALLFFGTAAAAVLWMTQISPAVCWAYTCWPTRIYPNLPPIVRQLMIIGKLAAVFALILIIFCITVLPMSLFRGDSQDANFMGFFLYQIVGMLVLLGSGIVVRFFTSRHSEVPQLGFWPVLAVLAMNLMLLCYSRSLLFMNGDRPSIVLRNLGLFFGCLFIAIMAYLVLKRDFLRVRAIPGLTMLILILFVPLAVHKSERMVTPILMSGPFFRERGAEMVAIMLIMLFFPRMHHWLHEVLLKFSVPKLRHIEHRVEHALEKIVDAEDDQERIHMITELFEQLHVKEYVFLSRRPHGVFVVDINTRGKEIAPSMEMSEAVRKFLGHRKHFIDLQTMAFEWPFFFHQFELHRIAEATGCRFLLPISVGESVRGLLLLPDGPGGTVVANPAMSVNINNLGIAAALNRPRKA